VNKTGTDHIKELLHIWKDTDVDAYLKIKEKIKSGIEINLEMKGKHLFVAFDESRCFFDSLFNRILMKCGIHKLVVHSTARDPFKTLLMLRNFSSMVFFEAGDVFDLELTTEFGAIKMTAKVSEEIDLQVINQVMKNEEILKREWVNVSIKIKLIHESRDRKELESTCRIDSSPLQNITFLNQLAIMKTSSNTMHFDILQKRLKFFLISDLEDLDFKRIPLPEKDFYIYYLLCYYSFNSYYWHWDREDCLAAVFKRYNDDITLRHNLLSKIKNPINLGKTNI
jgi:hypothetical protein